MTLSMVFVLYLVGMVITFLLLPIIEDSVDCPEVLLITSLLFPITWAFFFGQKYLDFLEMLRNEKNR